MRLWWRDLLSRRARICRRCCRACQPPRCPRQQVRACKEAGANLKRRSWGQKEGGKEEVGQSRACKSGGQKGKQGSMGGDLGRPCRLCSVL
eukprot:365304-Chlamydomonas_euryale.AAC.3